jgi:hypothetical protein
MEARMINFTSSLLVTIVRSNGSRIILGAPFVRKEIVQPISFWRRLWWTLKGEGLINMGFLAFLAWVLHHNHEISLPLFGLVTSAGIDYMAGDFAANGNDVSNFNYHESGIGTAAENVADTDLQSKITLSRVAGTQTKPASVGSFQSVATIGPYGSTYSIAEWGLFSSAGFGSPPSGGTLWDRRRISPTAGVNASDSIIFDYLCTGQAGGS